MFLVLNKACRKKEFLLQRLLHNETFSFPQPAPARKTEKKCYGFLDENTQGQNDDNCRLKLKQEYD